MKAQTYHQIYHYCIRLLVLPKIAFITLYLDASNLGEPSVIQIRPSMVNWNMETNWESQYFSQGRDNLDGAPLSTITVDFEEGHFSGGFWFGQSTGVDYREYQSFLGFSESFGIVDVSLNATQVQIVETDEFDQELGVSLSLGSVRGIDLVMDSYYSVESDGWFGEFGISKHLEYFENFHYDVHASVGYNMGYISEGHLGMNNAELVWTFEYHVNPTMSVVGYSGYSWALGAKNAFEGDRCLQNSVRYGFGFSIAFEKRS